MNSNEMSLFLITYLLTERKQENLTIPADFESRCSLLRALMNVRPPLPVSTEFLTIQDRFLQEIIADKSIIDAKSIPITLGHERISLWQGDITTLSIDAVVNAANSRMLGCFMPNHRCIDNAIHYHAGTQLRMACNELMQAQGHDEPVGQAKITQGYNPPCKIRYPYRRPLYTQCFDNKGCKTVGELLYLLFGSCRTGGM